MVLRGRRQACCGPRPPVRGEQRWEASLLLAFPTLFEPLIPLAPQTDDLEGRLCVVASLLTACAIVAYRSAPTADASSPATLESRRPSNLRVRGVLVNGCDGWRFRSRHPDLMLGVTTYLSTDVAAVPLLWVLPLAFYLLTVLVAFGWYAEARTP